MFYLDMFNKSNITDNNEHPYKKYELSQHEMNRIKLMNDNKFSHLIKDVEHLRESKKFKRLLKNKYDSKFEDEDFFNHKSFCFMAEYGFDVRIFLFKRLDELQHSRYKTEIKDMLIIEKDGVKFLVKASIIN